MENLLRQRLYRGQYRNGVGDAPADGVVAVVVQDDDYGRYVLNGTNYYYHQERGERNDKALTNDIGPQLRKRCPWLKFGVGTSRKEWKEILLKATNDPDFPKMSPQRRMEDGLHRSEL